MRLRAEQLPSHVEKPLLPIYLVSGDEPLQLNEATDALRAAARAQGYSEREVLQVETGFDWSALAAAGSNLSLFAERRLIELRMPSGKPGDAGSKALSAYAAAATLDNLLLISCGKLDKQQQKSKWFTALEGAGAVIQIWPVEPPALPGWIGQRLRSRGLQPTVEAAQLLAERVEGNLLAAAQEVEKLALLCGAGPLDAEQVRSAVADSARYDVFELADTALAGDGARCARVLEGLRGEGDEPVLILWALVREVRALAQIAAGQAGGTPLDTLLQQHKVWDKRKPLYLAALKRHNLRRWRALLRRAARLDRICKGAEPGNPWDELLQFSLLMAGVRIV